MIKISPKNTSQYVKKSLNGYTGCSHKCAFGNLYAKRRLEKSFFGYHTSVLKSGVQKYARRGELEKGLWCLIEMDLFSLLEWNGPVLLKC